MLTKVSIYISGTKLLKSNKGVNTNAVNILCKFFYLESVFFTVEI